MTKNKKTDGTSFSLTAMFFRQMISKELGNVSIIIKGEADIKDYVYLGGRYVDIDLIELEVVKSQGGEEIHDTCLLYTSPSPRDGLLSRMPSSA